MTNKFLSIIVLSILLISTTSLEARRYTIDNFENGDLTQPKKWFKFGQVDMSTYRNNKKEASYLGVFSLDIQGKSNKGYIGGVGTALGIDMRPYDTLKLLVRGNGENSGTLMIQLFDDDNGTYKLEQNPERPGFLLYDDKFSYTQKVTWHGWKVIIIPLSFFRDSNPKTGDNIWNPYKTKNSGGLIQMQILAFANEGLDRVNIQIDELKFYNDPKY